MSVLDLTDAEADGWLSGQLSRPVAMSEDGPSSVERLSVGPAVTVTSDDTMEPTGPGRLHLLLGDSVARDSGLKVADVADDILRRARGGATWSSTLRRLPEDLAAWKSATSAFGLNLGLAVVWLSGNDIYSRLTGLPQKDRDHLAEIKGVARRVVRDLSQVGHVAEGGVLQEGGHVTGGGGSSDSGPLPRLAGELSGATWGSSAAFHLERALLKTDFGESVKVVPMGRALTKKISHKRSGICPGNAVWYRRDGVHLSKAGYAKVASKLPDWLTIEDVE